jgi:hypothetical protein
MRLYSTDIERIRSNIDLHQRINEKFGETQLNTITVLDTSKNPIGTIQFDENNRSFFQIIGTGTAKTNRTM